MSDAKRLARQAKTELDLIGKAFMEMRKRDIEDLLSSTSPDQAYKGVLAVRALDSLRKSLENIMDTALIEEEAETHGS